MVDFFLSRKIGQFPCSNIHSLRPVFLLAVRTLKAATPSSWAFAHAIEYLDWSNDTLKWISPEFSSELN